MSETEVRAESPKSPLKIDDEENDVQTKPSTPAKNTPSKRKSNIEKARAESEELIKSMGGTVEGGRRTRSSVRGPATPIVAATPPPSKKPRVSTPSSRRGRPKKDDIVEDGKNETDSNESPSKKSENDNEKLQEKDEAEKMETDENDVTENNGVTKAESKKEVKETDVVSSEKTKKDDAVDGNNKKKDDVAAAAAAIVSTTSSDTKETPSTTTTTTSANKTTTTTTTTTTPTTATTTTTTTTTTTKETNCNVDKTEEVEKKSVEKVAEQQKVENSTSSVPAKLDQKVVGQTKIATSSPVVTTTTTSSTSSTTFTTTTATPTAITTTTSSIENPKNDSIKQSANRLSSSSSSTTNDESSTKVSVHGTTLNNLTTKVATAVDVDGSSTAAVKVIENQKGDGKTVQSGEVNQSSNTTGTSTATVTTTTTTVASTVAAAL